MFLWHRHVGSRTCVRSRRSAMCVAMNITLLAKKGGVGKGTLSILLYEAFRVAGKSVQRLGRSGNKALELILGPGPNKQPTKTDIVIYDTPQAWNTPPQQRPFAMPTSFSWSPPPPLRTSGK